MLPILTLQRHEQAVHSLAVWQDFVFTGSEDMEIKVGLHARVCNTVDPQLSGPRHGIFINILGALDFSLVRIAKKVESMQVSG